MVVSALAATWRARATELRRWAAAEGAACALECAADELEQALRRDSEEVLTLEEAARRSGYSSDHLGTLVRKGKLHNYGRRGRPLVAWGEVPRKPGTLTAPPQLGIVPRADRRSLARSALTDQERSANAK